MTSPLRFLSKSAIMTSLALVLLSSVSDAQVSKLLKQDGDVGDPLGTYYLGVNTPIPIILGPSAHGYAIANVNWSYVYTYTDCTESPAVAFGHGTEINVTVTAVGTYTISAAITYQTQSTNPPTTPAPNTVTGSFTISPPSGATMVNYNANAAYPLNQRATIHWQLQYGGSAAPGYNMEPEEKITVTFPPNIPVNWNGDWGTGTQTPFLGLDLNGLISDGKGPGGAPFVQQPAGTIMWQYTQVLGVYWVDLCFNPHNIELGTYTVTYKMANDGSPTWNCIMTKIN